MTTDSASDQRSDEKRGESCIYCERRLATQADYDSTKEGEGEHLCWSEFGNDPSCRQGDEDQIIRELRDKLTAAQAAAEEAKRKWTLADRIHGGLFALAEIESWAEGWLPQSDDVYVWCWTDHYDNSLEMCIAGVGPEYRVSDDKVEHIIKMFGFSIVWFHFADGTEQTLNGPRKKPNIVRYNEDGNIAKLRKAESDRDRLAADLARAREALDKYGMHLPSCEIDLHEAFLACTCGFEDAIKALEQAPADGGGSKYVPSR